MYLYTYVEFRNIDIENNQNNQNVCNSILI